MYKPKNKWIITFEGSSDCTGKTTLINEFNKVTNYSHLLRDRGTLSTRAYARKFGREIEDDFQLIESFINSYPYHLLVYLTASKEDVKKRQSIKNDGYDANDYDIDKSKLVKRSYNDTTTLATVFYGIVYLIIEFFDSIKINLKDNIYLIIGFFIITIIYELFIYLSISNANKETSEILNKKK